MLGLNRLTAKASRHLRGFLKSDKNRLTGYLNQQPRLSLSSTIYTKLDELTLHTKPEEIQQDALNAIAASLAMHERLQQLNEHLLAQNKPKIEFGIGIHTGLIIAGSVGGSRRLNYSVLGDTVNIAARLEAMNKDVKEGNPYHLLVTGETYGYVRDRYYARPVKNLQLRGRERETLICAILGKK